MFRHLRTIGIALLPLPFCSPSLAQPPSCAPVAPNSASVCVSWPDARKFKAPYRMVAMVPGCDGFDGAGYDGRHSEKLDGESDLDFKRRVAQRVADFRKGLVQQYAQRSRDLLEQGIGVVRIDFTKPEPKSKVKQATNCSHAANGDALKNVATRLGEGLAVVRAKHKAKIQDQEIYVVASSLGGGGLLQLYKDWANTPAARKPSRAVVFFPACRDDVKQWVAPIPTLLLLGKNDTIPVGYKPAERRIVGLTENCRDQSTTGGNKLHLLEFENTYHGFSVPGPTEPMRSILTITTPPYRFVAFAYNAAAAAQAHKALLDKLK